ncbi:hypothetical protein GCM10023169_15700 [Georgenia halophila]|uniref:Uncharacterized protein n=1 Tax=Georgenia halophila TaxID=620889 RepID=A0ABP8L5E7_9MICO
MRQDQPAAMTSVRGTPLTTDELAAGSEPVDVGGLAGDAVGLRARPSRPPRFPLLSLIYPCHL